MQQPITVNMNTLAWDFIVLDAFYRRSRSVRQYGKNSWLPTNSVPLQTNRGFSSLKSTLSGESLPLLLRDKHCM